MKLDSQSLTPLYQQVHEDLKAGIATGTYRPGDRIPSEAELSELYGVSRVTIRRAIEELAGEGYLTRCQGKGTYVNHPKMTRKIRQTSEVQSFTDLCAQAGMVAGARVLEQRIVTTHADQQRFFGANCRELVFVSRIRTADGTPIMEEDNYFPREDYAFLLDADLRDVSLFGLIQANSVGGSFDCSESTIEVTRANAALAERLEIAAGDPLFFEHVLFVDQAGRPACISNKHLVGSRYLFAF